jgi:hypothetical protein
VPFAAPSVCAPVRAIECDSGRITRVTRETWTERFRGFTWSSCSVHEMLFQEIGTTFIAMLEGSYSLRFARSLRKLFCDCETTAVNEMNGRKRYHITQ